MWFTMFTMKSRSNFSGWKIKKLEIFAIVILLFFINPVGAQPVNIDIYIKNSFSLGETVSFNYTIASQTPQQITFIPYVECPQAPAKLIQEFTVAVSPDNPYRGSYRYLKVEEFIEPQTCIAYIQIVKPFSQIERKEFKIETLPSFEFNIFICKDPSCKEKSKIFTKEEAIYLNYSSEIEHPVINATLIYPNGSEIHLNLPVSLKPKQIGTYTLKVIISKEGYKTKTLSTQFAIIERGAEIKGEICNKNSICEPEKGENYGTCPQDCPSGSKDGYCDKVKDGKCDPDCLAEEDTDCRERFQITQNITAMEKTNKKVKDLIVFVAGIIGIIVIFLIIKFLRRK